MGDDPECDGAAGAGGLRGVRPRDRTAAAPCVGGELRPGGGAGGDVDALSWAWEHWDRIEGASNKLGYLYRVGQNSARRNGSAGAARPV